MLGIVFNMSANLITGRYYRRMQRVNDDFGAAKIFKTQIPTDVNVSKAVDFMPVVLTNPQSAGAKAFTPVSPRVLQKLKVTLDTKEQATKLELAKLDLANLD